MPITSVDPPFIIDVEASGLGPWSYPVEIGVALQPGKRYSVLVAPAEGWTWWDEQAERFHRIPRDVLIEHGKDVVQVADELNALLTGKTLYSDGWVVDKPWLTELYFRARTRMAFDVSPIEQLLSPAQIAVWDTTKREVIESLSVTRHRASLDAMMIQETFIRSARAVGGGRSFRPP